MAAPIATGGTVTTDGIYTVHTFTANGTLVVSQAGDAEVLIVAGGGKGGGSNGQRSGGGGGAGGLIHLSTMALGVGSLSIVIGAGGTSGNGGNSTFNGQTAVGGGKGGDTAGSGSVGGSGGGSRHGSSFPGAAGTAGQGSAGGAQGFDSGSGTGIFTGSGGGGAGAVGTQGTNLAGGKGGDGVQYNMDGTLKYYAGGGGGSVAAYGGQTTVHSGAGGQGGGGAGTDAFGSGGGAPGSVGVAGTANTGGGGGAGGGDSGAAGGNGGSGIVIIRYAPSGITATLPLGLAVSGAMTHPDTVDMSKRLPLQLSSAMTSPFSERTLDMTARMPLGLAATFGTTYVRPAASCSLLLEVFEPPSLEYDASDSSAVVAWSVSTDPAHARPWLLAPRQYAEQEIDPIACTASIGQVEIGVIDVPEVAGDQDTGWMTARVHDLLGRRCRLTRYIDATIGWVVIADGPAGNPSMDGSYSAFRWTIRDTREIERKMSAFQFGGTAGIVPRGAVYGFGYYTDQTGDHVLLSALLDDPAPVWGVMQIDNVGSQWVGKVVLDAHYSPQVDPSAPTPTTINIWHKSLESIDQWANFHRANGDDPYDMSSGHGNQGLDAIIVSKGITVADFNAQAIALGISFGPGTAWIQGYRDALVQALAQPSAAPLLPFIDDPRIALDDDAVEATQTIEIFGGVFSANNADVLFRTQGDTVWSASRPTSPDNLIRPFVETQEYVDGVALTSVLLFNDASVPAGFPAQGAIVEIIIRHRGAASEAFPFYLEGTMGGILTNFYNGVYTLTPVEGIEGVLYDPGTQDSYATEASDKVRYDPIPFGQMLEPVLLRQEEPVTDGRTWTEERFYAPSGWIPALNNDAIISPVLRNRPQTIDTTLEINNPRAVPTPGWNIGQRTVSEIVYTYSRFFIPGSTDNYEIALDGLAVRPITVAFRDPASEKRYGQQIVSYDATAFSAVGDHAGHSIVGTQETASIMAQAANLDILERYRAGVQTFSINVRRTAIPNVRVGGWLPWSLSWFPSRTTGLRGSVVDAAQIIGIRDDNCVWRTLTVEDSTGTGSLGGQPGYADTATVLATDEPDPGLANTAVVYSDEEDLGS
jgi:hypothetical protein